MSPNGLKLRTIALSMTLNHVVMSKIAISIKNCIFDSWLLMTFSASVVMHQHSQASFQCLRVAPEPWMIIRWSDDFWRWCCGSRKGKLLLSWQLKWLGAWFEIYAPGFDSHFVHLEFLFKLIPRCFYCCGMMQTTLESSKKSWEITMRLSLAL